LTATKKNLFFWLVPIPYFNTVKFVTLENTLKSCMCVYITIETETL
jgi:hypothetical protein